MNECLWTAEKERRGTKDEAMLRMRELAMSRPKRNKRVVDGEEGRQF
jgi:hypothetical protein